MVHRMTGGDRGHARRRGGLGETMEPYRLVRLAPRCQGEIGAIGEVGA